MIKIKKNSTKMRALVETTQLYLFHNKQHKFTQHAMQRWKLAVAVDKPNGQFSTFLINVENWPTVC